MISHKQTILGEHGNCWQTAIASLLDLPLEAVPGFCNFPPDENGFNPQWYEDTISWLKTNGLRIMRFYGPQLERVRPRDGLFYLMSGPSPRGYQHCVVGTGDMKLVHDPHPDGTGLRRIDEVEFLVPIEPLDTGQN